MKARLIVLRIGDLFAQYFALTNKLPITIAVRSALPSIFQGLLYIADPDLPQDTTFPGCSCLS